MSDQRAVEGRQAVSGGQDSFTDRAICIKDLKIDIVPARIDGAGAGDCGTEAQGIECGDSDRRNAKSESETAGRRDRNPDPCKIAWANSDPDDVKVPRADACHAHDLLAQGYEPFRLTVRHRLASLGEHRVTTQDGHAAGRRTGVEPEDNGTASGHGAAIGSGCLGHRACGDQVATGRTSVTSGM
jgi:hypothetical protein